MISKKRFPRNQGVYFHFCVAFITEPINLLACAFNSIEYKKALEEEVAIASTSKETLPDKNPV